MIIELFANIILKDVTNILAFARIHWIGSHTALKVKHFTSELQIKFLKPKSKENRIERFTHDEREYNNITEQMIF